MDWKYVKNEKFQTIFENNKRLESVFYNFYKLEIYPRALSLVSTSLIIWSELGLIGEHLIWEEILVETYANFSPKIFKSSSLKFKKFSKLFFFSYTHKLEVQNYVVFSTIVN